MRYMKQFRYYKDKPQENYPKGLSKEDLCNKNIFKECGLITHLGIQAAPGTTFQLNGNALPIMVGSTGIYELNLEDLSSIYSIYFYASSLENLDGNGLLIDIIYEGAGNNL